MNISNSMNNVNFGKVYAIAGTDKQMEKLRKCYANTSSDYLYLEPKKSNPNFIQKLFKPDSSKNLKRIALIVVGKKDIENISNNKKGWRSLKEICKHVEKFADLTKVKS